MTGAIDFSIGGVVGLSKEQAILQTTPERCIGVFVSSNLDVSCSTDLERRQKGQDSNHRREFTAHYLQRMAVLRCKRLEH